MNELIRKEYAKELEEAYAEGLAIGREEMTREMIKAMIRGKCTYEMVQKCSEMPEEAMGRMIEQVRKTGFTAEDVNH